MAEKTRDAEDRALESLFRSEALADDGFSDRIVKRIRRQIWLRRLTLPVALMIGVTVSIGPLLELLQVGQRLLGALPTDWLALPAESMPQLPLVLFGGALFVICWLSIRMLEE